ncbi:MAG TPA: von Willebrand factor type A domain-containing protein, partial [Daejeonella sp.]|nr:von Willebrand factor type A domain-containing protein [Daejeonella sp.]
MKATGIILSAFLFLLIVAFNNPFSRTITGEVLDATSNTPLAGVMVKAKGSSATSQTDSLGQFKIKLADGIQTLIFQLKGFKTREMKVGETDFIRVSLTSVMSLSETALKSIKQQKMALPGSISAMVTPISAGNAQYHSDEQIAHNTESYNAINENRFLAAKDNPLSTFGIDVDAASYS